MQRVDVSAHTPRTQERGAPVSADHAHHVTYRSDIDGLRAVAVAAVIFYHAHVPGFAGGYVGVDVFFVISGYLITQLLTAAPGHAPMGLAEFYFRRARRILPALLVTTSVVAVAAVVLLLPLDLIRFGKYLASSAVGVTNITALHDANYFDSGAVDVPLLHYWSLAVEEQFYLVYPAVLLLLAKYLPRHRVLAVAAVAGVSLAACVWGSYYYPGQSFYLAPPRGWELLLGALVALSAESRSIQPRAAVSWLRHPLVNELLAAASVLLIALAVYSYDAYTRYPGVLTIVPCVATAVLIATGRGRATWISRLLSVRPLVYTGLISYSLYLWHLPILVLFTYFNIEALDTVQVVALIALTYALAAASSRLIEKPIRSRSMLATNRSFVAASLTLTAVIVVGGVLLSGSDGLAWRLSPEVVAEAAVAGPHPDMERLCGLVLEDGIPPDRLCRYGPSLSGWPIMLVWGDSHAAALIPAYEKLASAHHMQLFIVGRGGCRPLLGVVSRLLPDPNRSICARFNAAVARAIPRLNPRLVVLNAHWLESDSDLTPQPELFAAPGEPKLRRALQQTVELVGPPNRPVCVVLDVPTWNYDAPYAVAMAHRRSISTDKFRLDAAEAAGQYREFEQHARALRQLGMVRLADPKDLLCSSGSCALEAGGQPLYRDRNHVSPAGAQFVMSSLESCFDGVP
jgi:peptidoglycan/LPS O-acetylase OafA/YrhL